VLTSEKTKNRLTGALPLRRNIFRGTTQFALSRHSQTPISPAPITRRLRAPLKARNAGSEVMAFEHSATGSHPARLSADFVVQSVFVNAFDVCDYITHHFSCQEILKIFVILHIFKIFFLFIFICR
jgi:hypothetical protein